MTALIKSVPGVIGAEAVGQQDLDSTTYVIESEPGIDIRKTLFSALAEKSYALIGLEQMGASLEDIFISLTEKQQKSTTSRKKRVSASKTEENT